MGVNAPSPLVSKILRFPPSILRNLSADAGSVFLFLDASLKMCPRLRLDAHCDFSKNRSMVFFVLFFVCVCVLVFFFLIQQTGNMIIYSNESSRGRCGGLMAVPLRRENINACFFKTRLGLCTNGKRRKTKPEFWSCNAGPTLFLPVWGPGTHIYMHTHTCSDIRTLRETLQPEKTTPFTMGLNQTACQEHQCERGGLKEWVQ